MKRAPLYRQTIELDKVKDKKQRTENFKQLNETYGFTKEVIQCYAVECKNQSKFLDQLGVHVIQKLAVRAFESVQKIAFGKAKKVHFKHEGEFVTLEGKNNETYLRFNNGYAMVGKNRKTMFSQTCLCGAIKKKPLNERTHHCECGVTMQRDLFSAYLAHQVTPENKLDLKTAELDDPFYLPALEKGLNVLKQLKRSLHNR